MDRQRLTIVWEGFGWGCSYLNELRNIYIVDRGENFPWQVELSNLCDDDLMGIYDSFDDG